MCTIFVVRHGDSFLNVELLGTVLDTGSAFFKRLWNYVYHVSLRLPSFPTLDTLRYHLMLYFK
jgi:hypothetical protein